MMLGKYGPYADSFSEEQAVRIARENFLDAGASQFGVTARVMNICGLKLTMCLKWLTRRRVPKQSTQRNPECVADGPCPTCKLSNC